MGYPTSVNETRMRLNAIVLLALTPAAVGCAGNVSGSAAPGDAEVVSTMSAVVVIERTIDANEGVRAEASARFVRVAAGSSGQDALRAIGAALELPARGSCAGVMALSGGVARSEPAQVVELLDVGTVSLEAAGTETRLVPRQLPDVTDVVSGVVYARAADPSLLPANTRYIVHVGGSAGREAFDVSVAAPADPSDVLVAGEDGRAAVMARGTSIDLAWTPNGPDDLVFADIQPSAVRCVLDGTSAGPTQGGSTGLVHAALSTSLMDDAGTIVIHRLHREPLHMRGLEGGEVRFDFARTVAYTRR
jgi:hypothetical protein